MRDMLDFAMCAGRFAAAVMERDISRARDVLSFVEEAYSRMAPPSSFPFEAVSSWISEVTELAFSRGTSLRQAMQAAAWPRYIW